MLERGYDLTIRMSPCKFHTESFGLIGRVIIDHDYFEPIGRVGLVENGFKAGCNVPFLVAGGNHNGNKRLNSEHLCIPRSPYARHERRNLCKVENEQDDAKVFESHTVIGAERMAAGSRVMSVPGNNEEAIYNSPPSTSIDRGQKWLWYGLFNGSIGVIHVPPVYQRGFRKKEKSCSRWKQYIDQEEHHRSIEGCGG